MPFHFVYFFSGFRLIIFHEPWKQNLCIIHFKLLGVLFKIFELEGILTTFIYLLFVLITDSVIKWLLASVPQSETSLSGEFRDFIVLTYYYRKLTIFVCLFRGQVIRLTPKTQNAVSHLKGLIKNFEVIVQRLFRTLQNIFDSASLQKLGTTKTQLFSQKSFIQKQHFGGVLIKRDSGNIQQICRRIFMAKFDFTLRHGCSPANLLHILRTYFPKNTSGGLVLFILEAWWGV